MEYGFDYKVNILKALAIILVVSGHLGISIIPLFPAYSFHMALFFFISGYLFKENHLINITSYIKGKAKRLLIPYFWYNLAYFIILFIVFKITGVFYVKPLTIKNYFIMPFVDSSQIPFLVQLWFVTQLFISLSLFIIFYKLFKKIWNNNIFHLLIFLSLALLGIQLSFLKINSLLLVTIRTLFSLFFIYLGFYYKNYIESKINIFSYKSIGLLIVIQSILWLFNADKNIPFGRTFGLYYNLATAYFPNLTVPILTGITGIWASLFLVNVFYPYLKNNKFINNIGKNTYHIMANHVVLIFLLSNLFIWLNHLPYSVRHDELFWICAPKKTVYFYFVVILMISTYMGVGINYLSNKYINKSQK